MKLLDYLFKYYAYDIGCRKIALNESIPTEEHPEKVSILTASERYWYADPFGFEQDDMLYIFLEIMDMHTGKGTIGYTVFNNGHFTPVQQILEEPFHLSYPNVFEVDGNIYMIPETCQANQLRLYRAVSFPTKWVLEKVLLDGINVVDASIYTEKTGTFWLYAKEFDVPTNSEGGCRWYTVDTKTFDLHEVSMPHFAEHRPGGNAFAIGDEQFRPLQDCTNCYGEKVLLYKISEHLNSSVGDSLTQIITPHIFTSKYKHKYTRIHTFNRTKNYEIVDFCYNRFYITKPLRRVLQIIKKHCK